MTDTPGASRDRRGAHEARRARRAAVTDPEIVMEAAALFLAVRARSIAETRRRLLHLGYAEDVTLEVLDRLGRMGYLDDRAFAQAWVESRDRAHPRGETALRQELRRKGVDDAVVRETLGMRASGRQEPMPGDRSDPVADPEMDEVRAGSVDRAAAERLLARKASSLARDPDPLKRRQKAYGLLARNGFDPGICRELSLRLPQHQGDDRDTDPDAEDGP